MPKSTSTIERQILNTAWLHVHKNHCELQDTTSLGPLCTFHFWIYIDLNKPILLQIWLDKNAETAKQISESAINHNESGFGK